MKKYFYWIGIGLSIALASYFFYFAVGVLKNYDFQVFMTPNLIFSIIAAALLYSLCIPISGWAWYILLRGMGVTWDAKNLSAIMGVTQIAKYIPGNIGQHIGRTALALAKGMSVGAYTGSVLIETVLAMLAGFFVGTFFILISPMPSFHILAEYKIMLFLMAIGLVVFTIVLPWFILSINNFAQRPFFAEKWEIQKITSPGYKAIGLAFFGYCLNYIVIGFGLWLISLAISGDMPFDYFYLTSVFALSWLLGFLTPGAPAGIGVREGIMALLLSGAGQNDEILLMITAMRFATIAGDGFVFVVAANYIRLNRLVKST